MNRYGDCYFGERLDARMVCDLLIFAAANMRIIAAIVIASILLVELVRRKK